jgi:hypothetical protein
MTDPRLSPSWHVRHGSDIPRISTTQAIACLGEDRDVGGAHIIEVTACIIGKVTGGGHPQDAPDATGPQLLLRDRHKGNHRGSHSRVL